MGIPGGANLLLAAAGGADAYQIEQSLRFSNNASEYLSRTLGSAPSSATSATISFWYKATQQDNGYRFFLCNDGSTDWSFTGGIQFESGFSWGDATFGSAENATGVTNYWTLNQNSSQPALRDATAWYHVVIIWDSANGTSTRRMQVYVNGVESSFYNYYGSIGSNRSCPWTRNGYSFKIGASSNAEFNMAELICVDGQQLAPTNFAEYNSDGVWAPIEYSGTYGNNGFYLKFDPDATNGIGHDHSGEGNNFSATGFSTSGASTDVFDDSPTNNFCTLNPWHYSYTSGASLSSGNLYFTNSSTTAYATVHGTMRVPATGKYYCEFTLGVASNMTTNVVLSNYEGKSFIWRHESGTSKTLYNSTETSTEGASSNGQICAFAIDNGTVKLYRANSLLHTWTQSVDGYVGIYTYLSWSNSVTFNFGQRPFNYTPPTDHVGWSTANLPAPDIINAQENFNVVTYTGNGSESGQAITGVGFQPDFLWIKNRGAGNNHYVSDVLRGAATALTTPYTSAEYTNNGNGYVSSFDSDGFTVIKNSAHPTLNGGDTNASSNTYVAWNWKAGGSGSSNTSGSITSTVSANASAGISIVTYTGSGSNATVGHGLGVAPKMVIIKSRSNSTEWIVYHSGVGATKFLNLDGTGAASTNSSVFNNTAPTSTTFAVGTVDAVNYSSYTYVAYCFAEVDGFSKFGSYTGNGSSSYGQYIWTGFKPAFLMIRRTNEAAGWGMVDDARNLHNPAHRYINANQANAEGVGSLGGGGKNYVDLCSNGFRLLDNSAGFNESNDTYIYMAFANSPAGGEGVAPSTAR